MGRHRVTSSRQAARQRGTPPRLRGGRGGRGGNLAAFGALVLVLELMAGGCDETHGSRSGADEVDAGSVVLKDVWIEAPHGARVGTDTGLRFYVDNDSQHGDAVVEVSTPLARIVRLQHDGHLVRQIPVASGSAEEVDGTTGHDGVELVGLRHAVRRGEWYPVTFTFDHSPPVTVQVTVAPVGLQKR